MYFVIHSTDPYLLARMCTDLQAEGWDFYDHSLHPFYKTAKWISVHPISGFFYLLEHNGVARPTRFTLTSKNYLKVLETILGNNFGK